jgi:hypothetical protein
MPIGLMTLMFYQGLFAYFLGSVFTYFLGSVFTYFLGSVMMIDDDSLLKFSLLRCLLIFSEPPVLRHLR